MHPPLLPSRPPIAPLASHIAPARAISHVPKLVCPPLANFSATHSFCNSAPKRSSVRALSNAQLELDSQAALPAETMAPTWTESIPSVPKARKLTDAAKQQRSASDEHGSGEKWAVEALQAIRTRGGGGGGERELARGEMCAARQRAFTVLGAGCAGEHPPFPSPLSSSCRREERARKQRSEGERAARQPRVNSCPRSVHMRLTRVVWAARAAVE